jgi:hypothetical protein
LEVFERDLSFGAELTGTRMAGVGGCASIRCTSRQRSVIHNGSYPLHHLFLVFLWAQFSDTHTKFVFH